MLGNHDVTLTQADSHAEPLAGRQSRAGSRSTSTRSSLGESWEPQRPNRVLARASLVHVQRAGHDLAMGRAPDRPFRHPRDRVQRGQATVGTPRKTAAHLPGHGNPTGATPPRSWRRSIAGDDLARFLLTYFCRTFGMSPTEPIVMPDGSTSPCVEAMRIYSGLFTRWVRMEKGRAQNALRAARRIGAATIWRGSPNDSRCSGQRSRGDGSHPQAGQRPRGGARQLRQQWFRVRPGAGHARPFTLTVVDLETAVGELFTVTGSRVVPINVPRMHSAILLRFRTTRATSGSSTMDEAAAPGQVEGGFQLLLGPRPPEAIDAGGGRIAIWLSDTVGPHGSTGSFTYTDGIKTLDFSFSCPFASTRTPSRRRFHFSTRVGNHAWRTGGVEGVAIRCRCGSTSGRRSGRCATRSPSWVDELGEYELPRYEFPEIAAVRAILRRARASRWRGEVLCLAHLRSGDGSPLLDPTKDLRTSSTTCRAATCSRSRYLTAGRSAT